MSELRREAKEKAKTLRKQLAALDKLTGGAGDDRIAARFGLEGQTAGSLAVAVEGNAGDDDLELALFGVAGLDDLFALLDGGPGFDTGRATSNVLVKNIEQFTPIGQ